MVNELNDSFFYLQIKYTCYNMWLVVIKMRKSEFAEAVIACEEELKDNKTEYKNKYTESERQEIYKLCRKLSRIVVPNNTTKIIVNDKELRSNFLKSITIFNSSFILDYFEYRTRSIRLIRDSRCLTSSDIELRYNIFKNKPKNMKIILPNKTLTLDDQIGYAHEIGHIPEIVRPRKNYLEYAEVLPMFMEYITTLGMLDDSKEAFSYFLRERLKNEQSAARDIMRIYKRIETNDTIIQKYFKQLFIDTYSFIESLDFCLNLINHMNYNPKEISKEIEAVIKGQSLIRTAENLEIVTDGCKTLENIIRN